MREHKHDCELPCEIKVESVQTGISKTAEVGLKLGPPIPDSERGWLSDFQPDFAVFDKVHFSRYFGRSNFYFIFDIARWPPQASSRAPKLICAVESLQVALSKVIDVFVGTSKNSLRRDTDTSSTMTTDAVATSPGPSSSKPESNDAEKKETEEWTELMGEDLLLKVRNHDTFYSRVQVLHVHAATISILTNFSPTIPL